MKIALFASGNGSNVQTIIDQVDAGQLAVKIACLVCDKPEAFVIERAKEVGIPVFVSTPKAFNCREEWERAVVTFLAPYQVDYVILAGFMRILKTPILNAYPNRIINIHPSYLPAFPGKNSIQDAYDAGASETGVTVFYVDAGIDTGTIIAQEKIKVHPKWTLKDLEEAVHLVEHRLYPKVLQMVQKELSGKEELNVL